MEGLTHDYVPMYAYSKVLSFNSFDVRSLIYETIGKHGTEYKRSSQHHASLKQDIQEDL